jgi:hypothetical protein
MVGGHIGKGSALFSDILKIRYTAADFGRSDSIGINVPPVSERNVPGFVVLLSESLMTIWLSITILMVNVAK